MKSDVVYILGLFESEQNLLFQHLRRFIEKMGFRCQGIELYSGNEFGSCSFTREMRRIQQIVNKNNPKMIIGHSLGAYIALQLHYMNQLLLLEPSLSIAEIMMPNIKKGESDIATYNDGKQEFLVSREFVLSLSKTPMIKKVCKISLVNEITIMAAGHGGHKIAELYKTYLPKANYAFLPDADHDFSKKQDVEKIIKTIKWLGIIPSRERV